MDVPRAPHNENPALYLLNWLRIKLTLFSILFGFENLFEKTGEIQKDMCVETPQMFLKTILQLILWNSFDVEFFF